MLSELSVNSPIKRYRFVNEKIKNKNRKQEPIVCDPQENYFKCKDRNRLKGWKKISHINSSRKMMLRVIKQNRLYIKNCYKEERKYNALDKDT